MNRVVFTITVVLLILLAGCGGAGGTGTIVEDDGQTDTGDFDADDVADNDTADAPQSDGDSEPVDGELTIHHIDVGQADSTLIVTPAGETILIDTGDWRQDGSIVIEYLDSLGIDRIDHLVGTHAHADHIGGHAAVIEHVEEDGDGVGTVYDSGIVHDTQTYENYLDAVEAYNVDLVVVEAGDRLPIDDEHVSGLVLNPPAGDSGTDLHYNSIAITFEFGDVRYLTTGDAEDDAESRMVDAWSDELATDLYHAGHHGSSTSSTSPFLDAVGPSVAVISSAYDSQYGHPHDEVLKRFAEDDIETYWTAVHGDIVFTTDGETIEIETGTEFSSDPEDLLAEKPDEDEKTENAALSPGAIEGVVSPAVG